MRSKGKSAHDLAEDPRLSSLAGDLEAPPVSVKASEEEIANVKQKLQDYSSADKSTLPSDKKSSTVSSTSKVYVRFYVFLSFVLLTYTNFT